MNTSIEYHKKSSVIFICLSILFSSIIFPQTYKTQYDTVDCSKYSCEQWGLNDGNCTDMDLEQWPAHCASCGQLSLFIQDKFEELDYNIYNSVLYCTLEEIRCKIAKDIGWLPSIGTENIYNNNGFKTENKTVIEQGFTYSYSSNWQGNRWVSSKTTVEVPEGYPNIIGWGRCGIKQKITFVNNGKDDSVPGISVGIYAYETPIALGNRIINDLYASLETNYNIARSHIYDQLNSATDGWTEDEKEGAIHSIKWNYSDSRMSATACEEKYFGTDIELEAEEIIEEEKENDWATEIDDNTIVEPPNLNPYDEQKFESGNDEINNSNEEETLKQIVCASAKPSFTEGSKFKRAKFTIGGTEPQRIKITLSNADNFAIKKEYGGLVYQVIKGTSWGNLTLEPGSYILSCNGGGALGLMSASVCIENPMVDQSPPLNLPPVTPRPDKDSDTTMEDSKPVLPEGPIERIFVRPAGKDAKTSSDHLTMLIGDEKGIAVWGVDAGGKEQNVTVDDWKLYDDDIGWITEGLHNPAPKDSRVKIKFKAGKKKDIPELKQVL